MTTGPVKRGLLGCELPSIRTVVIGSSVAAQYVTLERTTKPWATGWGSLRARIWFQLLAPTADPGVAPSRGLLSMFQPRGSPANRNSAPMIGGPCVSVTLATT